MGSIPGIERVWVEPHDWEIKRVADYGRIEAASLILLLPINWHNVNKLLSRDSLGIGYQM